MTLSRTRPKARLATLPKERMPAALAMPSVAGGISADWLDVVIRLLCSESGWSQ